MTVKKALERGKKEFDLIEQGFERIRGNQHYRNAKEWLDKAFEALKAGKGLIDEIEEKVKEIKSEQVGNG